MERAREVFAQLDGLSDVAIPTDPMLSQMLSVRAPIDHDWEKTAAAAAAKVWWFRVVRADDDAVNFQRLLAAETVAVAGADPMAAAARQAAWATLGEADVPMLAERALLHALEELIAMRERMWDPRLDALVPGAQGLRRFWSAAAPQLPPLAVIAGTGSLRERIQAALQTAVLAAPPPGVQAARFVLADEPDRRLLLAAFWHRVKVVCGEVQRHAEAVAARTRDPVRRQAYLELGRRCAELAGAVEALR